MMALVESGLTLKYMADEYDKVAKLTQSEGTSLDVQPLGLNHLYGGFVIYGLMIFICIMVFVSELAINCGMQRTNAIAKSMKKETPNESHPIEERRPVSLETAWIE